MDVKSLYQHMEEFSRWKRSFLEQVDALEHWVKKTGCGTQNIAALIEKVRRTLKREHFTIACVGEFSRGKTELINALLYMGHGQRLLPSQPGRTTMCPTEIFWDSNTGASYVRLLPIETRKTSTALHAFKKVPERWVTFQFDPQDPDSISQALAAVAATKSVSVDEARALGFDEADCGIDEFGEVLVPAWRHALLSIDHPLLRMGLRIVDTPGLNALGNEPELTLKILPDAHLILFLLSADAGVTKSDWRIWQEHIQPLREHCETGTLVLLNKIDSLWDDLLPQPHIEQQIAQLVSVTAQQLGVQQAQIQPISVKQGLLARSRHDKQLLQKSGLQKFEKLLKATIIAHHQEVKATRILKSCINLVAENEHHLNQQIIASRNELETLRNKSQTEISQELVKIRERIRTTHHNFHKQALALKMNQRMLESQMPRLLANINARVIKDEIDKVELELNSSWTTYGLARAISEFFDSLDSNFRHLLGDVERVNQLVRSFYARPEHGEKINKAVDYHLLSVTRSHQRFNNLRGRSEQFRKSLTSLLTHKGALIDRFVSTLVNEVTQVFAELTDNIQNWTSVVLQPLTQNNHYQKRLLEHHMMRLSRLRNDRMTVDEKLRLLQVNIQELQKHCAELQEIRQSLQVVSSVGDVLRSKPLNGAANTIDEIERPPLVLIKS